VLRLFPPAVITLINVEHTPCGSAGRGQVDQVVIIWILELCKLEHINLSVCF